MADGDRMQERSDLLAFVERHWRDLTLREARTLSVEVLEKRAYPLAVVKASLTYR